MLQTLLTLAKNAPEYLTLFCLAFTFFGLAMTVIARLTYWTKRDDEFVHKANGIILKLVAIAPTLGVNPRSKQLEEKVAELIKENEELKASTNVETPAQ